MSWGRSGVKSVLIYPPISTVTVPLVNVESLTNSLSVLPSTIDMVLGAVIEGTSLSAILTVTSSVIPSYSPLAAVSVSTTVSSSVSASSSPITLIGCGLLQLRLVKVSAVSPSVKSVPSGMFAVMVTSVLG